jgi:S1-C subfamily serine protease
MKLFKFARRVIPGLLTVKINDSLIRATANKNVVELKLEDTLLVVSSTPAEGFYGLKTGDRVVKVNGNDVHTTQGFIDDLDKSKDDVANVQILRNGQIMSVSIPKKGYSIFL